MVGIGIFNLYQNLAAAVACLQYSLGCNSSDVPGDLPSIILALSQTLVMHAVDHQCFLPAILEQVVVLSWPVLLVMIGTVLSWDTFTPILTIRAENNHDLVD